MQMFRTEKQNADTTVPLYDPESVRRVLARASEIETQAETELLSVVQVEALGAELGLSPQAVRIALGETVGSSADTGVVAGVPRRQVRGVLTQEQVKAAFMPNAWYSLVCFFLLAFVARMSHSGTMPNPVGLGCAVIIGLLVPVYLAFRSGYLSRNIRVGAVGGGLTTALLSIIATISLYLAVPNAGLQGVEAVILCLTALGVCAGMLGAFIRDWWDGLPRNADR